MLHWEQSVTVEQANPENGVCGKTTLQYIVVATALDAVIAVIAVS